MWKKVPSEPWEFWRERERERRRLMVEFDSYSSLLFEDCVFINPGAG
jgi:hypothetical protein